MYGLFYVCVGIVFCRLTLEKVHISDEFLNMHLLTTEFDHPEVTLCG